MIRDEGSVTASVQGGRPAERGRPGTDARSADCLHQPGVLRGELLDEMAVLFFAQRLAQRGKDGSSARSGIFIGQPGALAQLSDEVVDPDRACLFPTATPCPQLLSQIGEICGEAPRLRSAGRRAPPVPPG